MLSRIGCVLRGFRGSWAPPTHRIHPPPLLAAGRSSCCTWGSGAAKEQIFRYVHRCMGLSIGSGFEPPRTHSFVIVPAVINNNRFELLDQRKGYQLGQFQRTTPRDVEAGPRCLSASQPGFAERFPVPLHAASARPAPPNGMALFPRAPPASRARACRFRAAELVKCLCKGGDGVRQLIVPRCLAAHRLQLVARVLHSGEPPTVSEFEHINEEP